MAMLLLLDKTHKSAAPQPPALDLSFTSGILPTDCRFSRASTGTYFDSSGVMRTASVDTPRFNYDYNTSTGLWEASGLLIEPQRTNLFTNSNPPTNWALSGVTASDSSLLSPDGMTYFKNLNEGTGSSVHYAKPPLIAMNYNDIIMSVFARAGSEYILQMKAYAGSYTELYYANFDVSAGVVGHNAFTVAVPSIEAVGNSNYRISVKAKENTSGNHSTFYNALTNNLDTNGSLPSYLGSSGNINIWGEQYEVGSVATSYIPTNGSAVTRATDQLSFTIPSGISTIRCTFDDDSTQDISVSSGSYTVDPSVLNRLCLKRIQSV